MSMTGAETGSIALINAELQGGERTTVRIAGSWIRTLGAPPQPEDRVLDLAGDRLLPGLINAHDHLSLNSLPRVRTRARYTHVRQWIADVDRQRRAAGALSDAVAVPLAERLFLGGIKNLLAGATTVAHHDPLHAALCAPEFPTHVVTRYGWSHSLYLEGEEKVRGSHARTPAAWPWIIHAAEGVDEEAREEFCRLERLGCLAQNTVIVHGVALDESQRTRLAAASAALIWCPSSNLRLFGVTADVATLARQGRVALGTDSRLSGSCDLLAELRFASGLGVLDPQALEPLVTQDAARLLKLPDRGVLRQGARADLLVLPRSLPLASARRVDVRLVMVDGIARYGDREYAHRLAPPGSWCEVRVDGRSKLLHRDLAHRLSQLSARERGLELGAMQGEAA